MNTQRQQKPEPKVVELLAVGVPVSVMGDHGWIENGFRLITDLKSQNPYAAILVNNHDARFSPPNGLSWPNSAVVIILITDERAFTIHNKWAGNLTGVVTLNGRVTQKAAEDLRGILCPDYKENGAMLQRLYETLKAQAVRDVDTGKITALRDIAGQYERILAHAESCPVCSWHLAYHGNTPAPVDEQPPLSDFHVSQALERPQTQYHTGRHRAHLSSGSDASIT